MTKNQQRSRNRYGRGKFVLSFSSKNRQREQTPVDKDKQATETSDNKTDHEEGRDQNEITARNEDENSLDTNAIRNILREPSRIGGDDENPRVDDSSVSTFSSDSSDSLDRSEETTSHSSSRQNDVSSTMLSVMSTMLSVIRDDETFSSESSDESFVDDSDSFETFETQRIRSFETGENESFETQDNHSKSRSTGWWGFFQDDATSCASQDTTDVQSNATSRASQETTDLLSPTNTETESLDTRNLDKSDSIPASLPSVAQSASMKKPEKVESSSTSLVANELEHQIDFPSDGAPSKVVFPSDDASPELEDLSVETARGLHFWRSVFAEAEVLSLDKTNDAENPPQCPPVREQELIESQAAAKVEPTIEREPNHAWPFCGIAFGKAPTLEEESPEPSSVAGNHGHEVRDIKEGEGQDGSPRSVFGGLFFSWDAHSSASSCEHCRQPFSFTDKKVEDFVGNPRAGIKAHFHVSCIQGRAETAEKLKILLQQIVLFGNLNREKARMSKKVHRSEKNRAPKNRLRQSKTNHTGQPTFWDRLKQRTGMKSIPENKSATFDSSTVARGNLSKRKETCVSPRPLSTFPNKTKGGSLSRQQTPCTSRAEKQEFASQIAMAPITRSSMKHNVTTSPRHACSQSHESPSKPNGTRHLGRYSPQKLRRFQTPQTAVTSKETISSESSNYRDCRPILTGKGSSERRRLKDSHRDGRHTDTKRCLHSQDRRASSHVQKVEESTRRARRSESDDTIPCPRSSRFTSSDEGRDPNELIEPNGKGNANQNNVGAKDSSLGFRPPATDRGKIEESISNDDLVAAGQQLNVDDGGPVKNTNVGIRETKKRIFRFRPTNTA